MSSRNIRRLAAERARKEEELRKKEDGGKESDEDSDENNFSPQVSQINSGFAGLSVSSDSESELSALSDPPFELDEPYQDEAAALPDREKHGTSKKSGPNSDKKKNKKNKKKKGKKPDEMDEVEWSVQQVNDILGSPPEKAEDIVVDEKALKEKRVFSILPNNINVNYELAKVFGEEERLKKSRRGTRRMRHEIGLSPDVHPFRVKGLSMIRYKTDGDIKYFRYEHTQDYRARCNKLVQELRLKVHSQVRYENNLHSETCVEALLENCDFLYYVEEHTGANQALEQSIYFMQSVGEQSFNFVDGKTRLEYDIVENRPFHIAILKYLHVLTNIACHRTALELAKVLLNLDPSDPLGVIFIIDTLAIRAREFQWLVDLIDIWRESRQAHRLFHMRYSRALALFHLACKKKDYNGIDQATEALMKAIKYYPAVAMKILEFSKIAIPEDIKNHEIFDPPPNVAVSRDLDELMDLYAWLITPRWRESQVWKWFLDAVTDLIDQYDRSDILRDEFVQSAKLRAQLYRKLPYQIKRHLYAIKPMAKYITDGRMPQTNATVSFNPYPHEGQSIDTYNYFTEWIADIEPSQSTLMAFIQGLYPDIYHNGVLRHAMARELQEMSIQFNHNCYLFTGPRLVPNLAVAGEQIRVNRRQVVFVPRRYSDWDKVNPIDPVQIRNAVYDYGGQRLLFENLGIYFQLEELLHNDDFFDEEEEYPFLIGGALRLARYEHHIRQYEIGAVRYGPGIPFNHGYWNYEEFLDDLDHDFEGHDYREFQDAYDTETDLSDEDLHEGFIFGEHEHELEAPGLLNPIEDDDDYPMLAIVEDDPPVEGNDVPQRQEHQNETDQEAPAQGQEASEQEQKAPEQEQEASAQGQEAPAQEQEASAQGQEAPAQGQEASAQGQEAPAQGQEASAQKQEASAQEQKSPAQDRYAQWDDSLFNTEPLSYTRSSELFGRHSLPIRSQVFYNSHTYTQPVARGSQSVIRYIPTILDGTNDLSSPDITYGRPKFYTVHLPGDDNGRCELISDAERRRRMALFEQNAQESSSGRNDTDQPSTHQRDNNDQFVTNTNCSNVGDRQDYNEEEEEYISDRSDTDSRLPIIKKGSFEPIKLDPFSDDSSSEEFNKLDNPEVVRRRLQRLRRYFKTSLLYRDEEPPRPKKTKKVAKKTKKPSTASVPIGQDDSHSGDCKPGPGGGPSGSGNSGGSSETGLNGAGTSGSGPSVVDLSEAGSSVVYPNEAGPSVVDLSEAGPSVVDLNEAGPSVVDLSEAGPSVVDLSEAGPSVVDLSEDGPSVVDLSEDGPSVVDLSEAGPSGSGRVDHNQINLWEMVPSHNHRILHTGARAGDLIFSMRYNHPGFSRYLPGPLEYSMFPQYLYDLLLPFVRHRRQTPARVVPLLRNGLIHRRLIEKWFFYSGKRHASLTIYLQCDPDGGYSLLSHDYVVYNNQHRSLM